VYLNQKGFWDNIYGKNEIPELYFPLDFIRPSEITSEGGTLQLSLPKDILYSITHIASITGSTISNVLFSLYHILLSKWCNQDGVITGVLVSGRNHSDIENMPGVFMNFLPVMSFPKGSLTYLEYLKQFNQDVIDIYDHQNYPFEDLVNSYVKEKEVSKNPFFQTLFNFHSEKDIESETIGAFLKQLNIVITGVGSLNNQTSALDLKLDVFSYENKMDLFFEYNSRIFKKESISDLIERFNLLITTLVSAPDKKISDVILYSEDERAILKEKQKKNSKKVISENILNINICASFVVDPIIGYINHWMNELELKASVRLTDYNQVFQQLLNSSSVLHDSNSANIILLRFEDWVRDIKNVSSADKKQLLEENYSSLLEIIEQLNESIDQKYLWGILPVSSTPYVLDVQDKIAELNIRFEHFIKSKAGHYSIDFKDVADLYSVEEIFDEQTDELAHMPFTEEYYVAIGIYLSRKIYAFYSKPYKVIAVDCDNTLWKGVCGEDGLEGICIEEGHAYFQQFLLERSKEGFLLAIVSKNNEDDVWNIFENHPDMILKKDHFVSYAINWLSKSKNIIDIAKGLNLGVDSFIFLDDSLYECDEVTSSCSDVLVINVPEDSEELPSFLNHIWHFDRAIVSKEDILRNQFYAVEKERNEDKKKYSDLDSFIDSLNLKVDIQALTNENIERVVSLMNRVNQFNLNGIVYSPAELAKFIEGENSICWAVDVSDRFGSYGNVGLIVAFLRDREIVVNSFMLSCRVLGRKVENFLFKELISYGIKNGCKTIEFDFKETPKNAPFKDFMNRYNFGALNNNGLRSYEISLNIHENKLIKSI